MLKLTLYVILASLWIKITKTGSNLHVPLPIGLAVGLFFASHEHFRMERRIEIAVLIIAGFFGFLAPFGLFITL